MVAYLWGKLNDKDLAMKAIKAMTTPENFSQSNLNWNYYQIHGNH